MSDDNKIVDLNTYKADKNNPLLAVNSLSFNNQNGELFTILEDGEIKLGHAFTTQDEASLAFWTAVINFLPAYKRGLLEHLKNESEDK